MVIRDAPSGQELIFEDGVVVAQPRWMYFSSLSRTDRCEGMDLITAEVEYGCGDLARGRINMQVAMSRGHMRKGNDGLYYNNKKIITSTTGERDLLNFTSAPIDMCSSQAQQLSDEKSKAVWEPEKTSSPSSTHRKALKAIEDKALEVCPPGSSSITGPITRRL